MSLVATSLCSGPTASSSELMNLSALGPPSSLVARVLTGGVHYSAGPFWSVDTGFYLVATTEIDVRWAYYSLLTQDINGMDSGSAIPSTSRDDLLALRVFVPPLSEQHRVAAILGALDDKIELNRRMAETLEEVARALFTSWFVDFDPVRGTATVPEDVRRLYPGRVVDSSIGPIPEGWQVAALSRLMTVSRESVDPRDHPDEFFDHYSLPAFDAGRVPASERGADIKSGKLKVADGCILLSKLNPRFPRVWWPSSSGPFRRIASTEFVVTLPRDYFTRSYLFGLLASSRFRSTFASLVRGTSGSHQRVSVADLLGIEVPIPPRPLVERFDAIVAPMFDQQEALQAESKTLAELRDTLLPKLISGELRLAEPATRPA